jgi:hypothetical protein
LKTVTITEQQAICEALISVPSFRRDIIQHVHQFQYLENMVKLNQIFGRTSTDFSRYLSAKFSSTSGMTGIRSTLLVSMPLSELNSYVIFLNDNPISQTVDRTCLEALKEKPIQLLNVEAASMTSTLLYSYVAGIENVEIIRIEQALTEKTRIDASASSFVLEWFCYRHDPRLAHSLIMVLYY